MPKVNKEQAQEILSKGSAKVTDKDVEGLLAKSDEIRRKFEHSGPLGRFITDVKLLMSLLSDYWNEKYKEVPWWVISAVVVALLYVLNPLDLIPDVIPGVGLLDDAAVVAACLAMCEHELHKYKKWKIENPD